MELLKLKTNRRKLVALLSIAWPLLLSGQASQASDPEDNSAGNAVVETVEVDNETRSCIVHLPGKREKLCPAVVLLHGGGGKAQGMVKLTGFDSTADSHGFISIYPEGNGYWNDGRPIKDRVKRNDVKFIDRMLETLTSKYSIDPARIYVTGISNGGFFTERLVLELPERFAAAAVVDADMTDTLKTFGAGKKLMPLLFVLGTKDPLVPFDGGPIAGMLGRGRGEVLSFTESMKYWTAHNHCLGSYEQVHLPVRDSSDDTTVDKLTYKALPDGQPVTIFKVLGGGHTWPSGKQYLPKVIIGDTTHQISNEDLWSFFDNATKHTSE